MSSLYRRVLGEKLDQWPDSLREFHDIEEETVFEGTFRITRRKGWIARFLCWISRLPPAAESVPIRLRVVPDGERELWIRHFGEHELRSVQWLHRGELLEKLGPVTFSYDLIVEENAFRMFTKKTWLFGWIPWPRFLSPKGTGEEIAEGDSIRADVRVKMPLLGEIIRYEGTVTRC